MKRISLKACSSIVTTKKELHLYVIEDNKSCHYCGDDGSLLSHSFLGCHIAVDFPEAVLRWFKEKENASEQLLIAIIK